MAEVVGGFKAGGGRQRVEEAAKAKEELNDIAMKIFQFGERLATLAQAEAEHSCSTKTKWEEAIDHLSLMMCSTTHKIRERAAATLAVMSRTNSTIRTKICEDKRIIKQLVKQMNEGSLDAIDAIEGLVNTTELACDQVRLAGGISILSGFINMDDGAAQNAGKSDIGSDFDGDEKQRRDQERAQVALKHQRTNSQLSERVHELADLRDGKLELAFGQMGVGADDRPNAEGAATRYVPVASKAQVVSALRSIATSNDANREVITREKVIPALVKLMTKMQAPEDGKSGRSGSSGHSAEKKSAAESAAGSIRSDGTSSVSSGGTKKKKSRQQRMAEALDRKHLAMENRRLAEAAGQMLHQLILEGRTDVKQIIISAIIATVQQPGSQPPSDVPALMAILRSAAEEQLSLVQKMDNVAALNSALEFGRWIKVPTIMLGEARNNFNKANAERKRKANNERDAVGRASSDADADADADANASPSTEGKSKRRIVRKKRPSAKALAEATAREAEATARAAEAERREAVQRHMERLAVESKRKLLDFRAALKEKSKNSRQAQTRLANASSSTVSISSLLRGSGDATEPHDVPLEPPPPWAPPVIDAERHFMAQEAYRKRAQQQLWAKQQQQLQQETSTISPQVWRGLGGPPTAPRTSPPAVPLRDASMIV